MKEYVPTYVGTVTKYVFVESPSTTPEILVIRAYEISKGVMIKETCFGLQVTGKREEVNELIQELRKIDPSHIFVKDRGFPPGDPRRCRANLGGARPGYYGHEFEMRLIRYIARGLEEVDKMAKGDYPEMPETYVHAPKLSVKKLQHIIEMEGP